MVNDQIINSNPTSLQLVMPASSDFPRMLNVSVKHITAKDFFVIQTSLNKEYRGTPTTIQSP
jgi:hypothetical protein